MNIIIHQTHQTIADFKEIFSYLKHSIITTTQSEQKTEPSLHVFPELFLAGYPLQDLCLQDSFIQKYLSFLEAINEWSLKLKKNSEQCFLLGGLHYENYNSHTQNYKLTNVIYKLIPGEKLENIYTKQLLPNYDIFDERKYFWAGKQPGHLEWKGYHLGLQICEDMWPSTFYEKDPSQELYQYFKAQKITPDAIINLSASPFALGKIDSRHARARSLSTIFKCPFIYVNKVGAEDEIIFDGSSFILSEKEPFFKQCDSFKSDELTYQLTKNSPHDFESLYESRPEDVWQNLFKAKLDTKNLPATLIKLTDTELEETLKALTFSLQEYASKNGFKHFIVALSGGMDSAMVLTLARLSLKEGQTLEAIYMPSQYSATLSYDLSLKLCQNLGVKFTSLPIKFLHSTCRNYFEQYFKEDLSGFADENIQSRLRATLLYGRSNQNGGMVINTSNKSELAVGYSTQYGDSVGALSLLGDMYKTEIYQLAEFINKKFPEIIPVDIIRRPPSAELREDQQDSQSLPDYKILDPLLEAILSYQYSPDEILKLGFAKSDTEKIFKLYRISEFKRYQFCPISKIKMKSFGFGYRLPISKNSAIYSPLNDIQGDPT